MLFEAINLKEKPASLVLLGSFIAGGCGFLIYFSSFLWLPFFRGDWSSVHLVISSFLIPLWGVEEGLRVVLGPLRFKDIRASPEGIRLETWTGAVTVISDNQAVHMSIKQKRRMAVVSIRIGKTKLHMITTLENSATLQAIMQTWESPSSTAA